MLSSLAYLNIKLRYRWVPKWFQAFYDVDHGGFYERLNYQFEPLPMGYKRLVTQCRQLSLYAHAGIDHKKLKPCFDFLVERYHVPETGGWRFSVTEEGAPKDNHYDLYAHGFVLFAMAHYYNATKDSKAHDLAIQTAEFIDKKFRLDKGFAEALDENLKPIDRIRRQNPHMHLLEGTLLAYQQWDDDIFQNLSQECYDLFDQFFFEQKTRTLGEFFDQNLKPHKDQGDQIEPGHHYEWVWLLHLYQDRFGHDENIKKQQKALFDWANHHGHDTEYGGIYNACTRTGEASDLNKRIWPSTEALKAHLCMLMDSHEDDREGVKKQLFESMRMLSGGYLQDRGFWTEILDQQLRPDTDFMPGTTVYHIYFGMTEALRLSEERSMGRKNENLIVIYTWKFLYRIRRGVAQLFKS